MNIIGLTWLKALIYSLSVGFVENVGNKKAIRIIRSELLYFFLAHYYLARNKGWNIQAYYYLYKLYRKYVDWEMVHQKVSSLKLAYSFDFNSLRSDKGREVQAKIIAHYFFMKVCSFSVSELG